MKRPSATAAAPADRLSRGRATRPRASRDHRAASRRPPRHAARAGPSATRPHSPGGRPAVRRSQLASNFTTAAGSSPRGSDRPRRSAPRREPPIASGELDLACHMQVAQQRPQRRDNLSLRRPDAPASGTHAPRTRSRRQRSNARPHPCLIMLGQEHPADTLEDLHRLSAPTPARTPGTGGSRRATRSIGPSAVIGSQRRHGPDLTQKRAVALSSSAARATSSTQPPRRARQELLQALRLSADPAACSRSSQRLR